MAARNVKSIAGFEAPDKMQSSTLKRQPSPDWSKNDLLRLLSYFEGELQARDIAIAALKAEKAKQLLYQAKYGRFGLGDPFVALQRDAIGTRDSHFDEAAVKSMYDNQLAQLENLIATQRKAQLKMREQLANAEKRYHKVCSELEEEKRKHAQDTAQGDDVTYMLEKERERLRQEIDFEKSNSKKLEKDLRRTLAALEEERASAARHKQVALLLLKERKHLLQKASASEQSLSQGDYNLPDEMRAEVMAEGLEVNSQRSLAMEAALEEQLSEVEAERVALRAGLDQEQSRTRELEAQVEALQRQVQSMASRTTMDSTEIKPGTSPPVSESYSATGLSSVHLQGAGRVSPGGGAYSTSPNQAFVRSSLGPDPVVGRPIAAMGNNTTSPVVRQVPGGGRPTDGGRIGSLSPERDVIHRPTDSPGRKVQYGSGAGGYAPMAVEKQGGASTLSTSPREARVVTVGSSGPDSGPLLIGSGGTAGGGGVAGGGGGGARVSITPGNTATVVTQGGGKISFHVSAGAGGVVVGGGGAGSPQRTVTGSPMGGGRGVPPPVPPNKPNLAPGGIGAGGKPAPPPKVAVIGRERAGGVDSKVVQIPVNVVASPTSSSASSSPGSSTQSSRESSPIRKTAQLSVEMEVPLGAPSNSSLAPSAVSSLDFLGPEMANLQEMLATLSTGEAGTRDSPGVDSPTSPSPLPSPSTPTPTPSLLSPAPSPVSLLTPSPQDVQTSAVHKMAASGDVGGLRMLIVDHDADVNLPMKDGTTPVHCAVDRDREGCLRLLLDNGGSASALRDDRVTPLHIAAARGHFGCLQMLLEHGSAVNTVNQSGDTALHLAVDWGHLACCQLLLTHGANATLPRTDGLTAVHYAVWRDRPDIVRCLLERLPAQESWAPILLTGPTQGPSLVHLAAQLSSQACLRVLLEHLPVNLNAVDNAGRSVFSVASPACALLLQQFGELSGDSTDLVVELKTQLEGATVSCTRIGHIEVAPSMSWGQLEDNLQAVLADFLSQLDHGLRTRRLLRMEAQSGCRDNSGFTLGISMSHISMFEMGFYRWSPGMQTEKLPHSIASNNSDKKVAIIIDDTDNLCELIAFDILHPLPVLHDYLRLVDQYKSVVFHGPVNSGKTYLVQRLAQCLACKQKALGGKPVIHQLKLSSKTSHEELLAYLKQKGCVLRLEEDSAVCPILILDNLEKVNMAALFGPLLEPLGQRGKQHAFCLSESLKSGGQRFYFPDTFCILATLNRTRSTGIELHVQQRFRWVQFRHDAEPLSNLLARHFLRRLYQVGNGQLPPPDDPMLRATEWIICVWQRLNDSLGKLGLADVALGPCSFFKCPIEKKNPLLILQWVQDLWNTVIAQQVREAVKKGTGSEGANQGQHKVANTALYVLMQRAIVVSCPLPAKEKEVYLQGFSGSNELDLPLPYKSGGGGGSGGVVSQLTSRHPNLPSAAEHDREGVSSPRHVSRSQHHGVAVSAAVKGRNKHREERGRTLEALTGSNIKRRSLSESSVNKAAQRLDQLEQQQEEEGEGEGPHRQRQDSTSSSSPLSHHAKVPKLEVRSSRILSLSNSFQTGGGFGGDGKPGGRISPLYLSGRPASHHHHHHHQKKSRSSENISPSGLYASGKYHNQNPFSFSLSTPKSSLSTFKFLGKSPPSAGTEPSASPSTFTAGGKESYTGVGQSGSSQTQVLDSSPTVVVAFGDGQQTVGDVSTGQGSL